MEVGDMWRQETYRIFPLIVKTGIEKRWFEEGKIGTLHALHYAKGGNNFFFTKKAGEQGVMGF